MSSTFAEKQIEKVFRMKVFSAVLGALLLAFSASAGSVEYSLSCSDEEMGIRWPSYVNNANYYVCQKEGGKQLMISCPIGQVFTFVYQVCTYPDKYIPPPPLEILPTSAPSAALAAVASLPSDESSAFLLHLPKPLIEVGPAAPTPHLVPAPVPQLVSTIRVPGTTVPPTTPESAVTESTTPPQSDAKVDVNAQQSLSKKPSAPVKAKDNVVKLAPVRESPKKIGAPMPPTPSPTPPILKKQKGKKAAGSKSKTAGNKGKKAAAKATSKPIAVKRKKKTAPVDKRKSSSVKKTTTN